MPKQATGSWLLGQYWGYESRSEGEEGRWENCGWSSRQHGGGWSDPCPLIRARHRHPPLELSAGRARLSLAGKTHTSIPEPAAPPRPRIISTALRSTASRTLTALTLTAQWSLSHGRMFHSYFSPVCLPEGVAVRIIAGPRSNSTAFAPHVTIWNDQILTVLVFPNPLFVFQMRPIQTFALALYRCCIAWPFLNVSITHGKWLEQ